MSTFPELPVAVMRYGHRAPWPTPIPLQAGPFRMMLDGVDLRYIRLGKTEVVRRLFVALRDDTWQTIPATYSDLVVDARADSFTVTFTASHVQGPVDFVWKGRIEGSADGVVRYAMDGAPRQPFLRNRIGICVLHPSDLAGIAATATTPDGEVVGTFPALISPHQPFVDMTGLHHLVGNGAEVVFAFSGDLFEMEDQRNWTDASFKSYSTPISLPMPVLVTPGDRIQQSVTMRFTGLVNLIEEASTAPDVVVGKAMLDVLPGLGFGLGEDLATITEDEIVQLRRLAPSHLLLELDLAAQGWRKRLAAAAKLAVQSDTMLELAVNAGHHREWEALATEIAAHDVPVACVYAYPPVPDPIELPRPDVLTDDTCFRAAAEAFAGSAISVGGGSRLYFTNLNRGHSRLLLAEFDRLTWSLNPQVHATDDLSFVETPGVQAATVRTARSFASGLPVTVGPITLRMRFNPSSYTPSPAPEPGQLSASIDPRQMSLVGAGWTVASIAALASEGVERATYSEVTGPRGLWAAGAQEEHPLFPATPGMRYPLFHVFAALAEFAGGPVHRISKADAEIAAIAVAREGRLRLLIANLTDEPRVARIDAQGLSGVVMRSLDETTYIEAASDPAFFADAGQPLGRSEDHCFHVPLLPFAVVALTGSAG